MTDEREQDADPLADADIGDSATVTHTEEIWLGDLDPQTTRQTDRLLEREVVDVEVTENEYGDQHLAVTTDVTMTKRLPHNWDADPSAEPPAAGDSRRSRAVSLLVGLGTVGLVSGVGIRIAETLSGEMTVNGEAVMVAPAGMLPAVGSAMLLWLLIMVVVGGGFPGYVGGGR